jgi:hypothetical protein
MQRTLSTFAISIALSTAAMAQWHQVTTATIPSARLDAAMTWDPSGHVLMFGGAPTFGTPNNETWTYNGSDWTRLLPATSPGGRASGGMVYDAWRGVAVLYGGANTTAFGGPSIDQTWEFDGTNWARVLTTATPGGLAWFGLAYDPIRHRTVLYGGDADSTFPISSASTWEYDGANWQQITTAASPGPLERPAMCYHQGMARTLVFGGINPQTGGNDNLWSYDGANWSIVPVTGVKPMARTGGRMVYDAARGVAILHGGANFNTGAVLSDTWEFDGSAWHQVAVAAPSPARWSVAMAMDPLHRQVVIYGGASSNGSALTGTFQYGASYLTFGTGCAGSNGVPALAGVDAPRIGTPFVLNLSNLALASSSAFVFTGISNTSSPLGALPLSLAGIGMPGCTLYVSADVLSIVPVAAGNATWSLPIPANAALIGQPFYNQAASIDPAANAAGLAASNAGAGIVGQ